MSILSFPSPERPKHSIAERVRKTEREIRPRVRSYKLKRWLRDTGNLFLDWLPALLVAAAVAVLCWASYVVWMRG